MRLKITTEDTCPSTIDSSKEIPSGSIDGRLTSETYVPLSRGFREHLPHFSGAGLKLYLLLLMDAQFAGPRKGKCAASLSDLALQLGLNRTTVFNAACKLRPKYIDWVPAKNQYSVTIFTVQAYKAVPDFAVSHAVRRNTNSSETPTEPSVNGESPNLREMDNLAPPKKIRIKDVHQLQKDFVHYASAAFEKKLGQPPSWLAKDFSGLANLLRRNPRITIEEFRRRWDIYLASSNRFIRDKGYSLAVFCSQFDGFISRQNDGPPLARALKAPLPSHKRSIL